ncbi:hypothetical protein [Thiomicrorhabdus sp.]|uniref:hypothetical protein n=1 Tax=Thiomicrorhabdus sp. TaxID=2039724 RepID=UPI003566137C
MPVQTFNDRDELNDLSDLNYHVIESIAYSFIQEHGQRCIHNGELKSYESEDTMASELHKMLSQPLLGLRQIIPLITFWISEFSLDFKDKLYEIEHKRLIEFQNLANQLEQMIASQEKVSIKLKLASFLAELQYHEIHEAIPILEQHFNLHYPCDSQDGFEIANNPPSTPEEALARLQNLLQFSEHEIDLTIDATDPHNTVFSNSQGSENAISDDSDNLHSQAERWLEKFQFDGVKFERFVEAYYAEPEEMQAAIDQAIVSKPIHFLSTEQHPKRDSLRERITQKIFRN